MISPTKFPHARFKKWNYQLMDAGRETGKTHIVRFSKEVSIKHAEAEICQKLDLDHHKVLVF